MAKVDPPTPLEETLQEWVSRFSLTTEERELLFVKALEPMTLRDFAKLRGVKLELIHVEGALLAKKVGHRDLANAALALLRGAYALAVFDKEKRDANRDDTDETDC